MNVLLRLLLWALALAVVALPVVGVLGGWVGADRWPLARLRVHAPMAQVSAEQVQSIVMPYARTGYFAVDLQGAQDALEVTLVEHQPLARWGDERLLSVQGKLIAIPEGLDVSNLPDLGGPDAQTEQVLELYGYAKPLFAHTGQPLQRLRWSLAATMHAAGCSVLPACCPSWWPRRRRRSCAPTFVIPMVSPSAGVRPMPQGSRTGHEPQG